MQPLRVLVASSSPPDRGWGINACARSLSESLVERGCAVHFLSPPAEDRSWLERFGIAHLVADQDVAPREAARLVLDYVAAERIDGAINNDNPYLQSVAPALSCPLLAVGHMDHRSVSALACYQHEWVDHVVAISSDMQRTFVSRYGVPLTKCPIIYNGVPDPGPRADACRESSVLRAVYAGGYTHNKGSKLVLEAALADPARWAGTHLDWFGDVPDGVRRRLADLSHVTVHGRVPREVLHETLADADVFVLASRREACPMALIEAMSFGVVPIASDGRGAMRWLVTSGSDGYICQLERFADQMLDCLEHLRTHPEALADMKRATRARYLADLRIEQVAERFVGLLGRPTVDRSEPPARIPILRWHRPMRADGEKAPLFDRLCIRMGILRRAGFLELAS